MARLDRKAVVAGQYYLKRGETDWLRLILRRHGDTITWADFSSYGQCSMDRLVKWAAERGPLDGSELAALASEVAKIERVGNEMGP